MKTDIANVYLPAASLMLFAVSLFALASPVRADDDSGEAAMTHEDMLGLMQDLYSESIRIPEASERKKRSAAPPPTLPEVPEFLDQLPPQTFEIEISSGDRQIRQLVSRTRQQVHVTMPDARLEWLFTRNPVDPRRVSGLLVDHRRHAILYHNDVNLRDGNIANGWLDVVTIGLRPSDFVGLVATDDRAEEFGIPFERYARDPGSPESAFVEEVWWNEETALPLRIVAGDGDRQWSQVLVLADPGVDESLFEAPKARYPDYLDIDAVDWAEELHGAPIPRSSNDASPQAAGHGD